MSALDSKNVREAAVRERGCADAAHGERARADAAAQREAAAHCTNVPRCANAPRRVVVLGSTGSIGTQTLNVIEQHPRELCCVGLSANTHVSALIEQAKRHGVRRLALASVPKNSADKEAFEHYLEAPQPAPCAGEMSPHVRGCAGETTPASVPAPAQTPASEPVPDMPHYGMEALLALARCPEADIVVNALVGAVGLRVSEAALQAGKTLALANKESLVVGGDILMRLAHTTGTLLPIDSEHGAIFQCLVGEQHAEVSRLWLTASGGPFFGKTLDQLRHITPAQALAHPTWHMGAKISIDSSTLMNKGLEVIEAHHLFNMPYERISVVVQPQSLIHSMVEFVDGSVKAHMGTTDMRIPIQYALSYPQRWSAPVAPLDFTTLSQLTFKAPDTITFPLLKLAYQAGKQGGVHPCVMNAANEVAVYAFLNGACAYTDIARCVETVLEHQIHYKQESIAQLEAIDIEARHKACRVLSVDYAQHQKMRGLA